MKPMALKHAMYFGLILGLVFSLNFFLSTINGVIANTLSWVIILLIPIATYRLTADCRDRVCEGEMSYGTALWYGIQLFFYASLVSAAFKLIYFKILNPDFLPNQLEQTLRLMEQLQMPLTDVQINEVKSVLTPFNMALNYVWLNVLAGLLVSLITGIFAKKNKSTLD